MIRSLASPFKTTDGRERAPALSFAHIKLVVIDEADQQLRNPDRSVLDEILKAVIEQSANFQTVLVSTTWSKHAIKLAKPLLRPNFVVAQAKSPMARLHWHLEYEQGEKFEAQREVFECEGPSRAIIFCNTSAEVEDLYEYWCQNGRSASNTMCIWSVDDIDFQSSVLERFASTVGAILICTDVISPGFHADDISLIVNFSFNADITNYVCRTGRTSKHGENDCCIVSLLSHRDSHLLLDFKRALDEQERREGNEEGFQMPVWGRCCCGREICIRNRHTLKEMNRGGATTCKLTKRRAFASCLFGDICVGCLERRGTPPVPEPGLAVPCPPHGLFHPPQKREADDWEDEEI